MRLNNSITLETYASNANKQFSEMQSRLTEIENSFQTRMNGKTTGGLVGSLIGAVLWLSAFASCALIIYYLNVLNESLLLVAMAIVSILIIFMIIDNIMDFSYYGKISSYKDSVSQLKSRVDLGRKSIHSNNDAFIKAYSKGWNYALKAAPSIPDDATSVEITMANMESLKKGFIHGAKNAFFYISVATIAIVGGIALFPVGKLIMEIGGAELSDDTTTVLNVIAIIISGIGTIIISKLIWSKTDCSVNNITLFATVIGPFAFLALIGIGTLIVYLAIAAFYILIFVAVIAILFVAICGG